MLRGAGRDELKAVKRVVAMAVNVAYNLRLEVSYLNDRRACLVQSLLPATRSMHAIGTPSASEGKHAESGESTPVPVTRTPSKEGKQDGDVPGGIPPEATVSLDDDEAKKAGPQGTIEFSMRDGEDIVTGSAREEEDIVRSVMDEAPILSSSLGVSFGETAPLARLKQTEGATTIKAEAASPAGKFAEASPGKSAVAGGGGGLTLVGEHLAYNSQSLMVTKVWMRQETQCRGAKMDTMWFYSKVKVRRHSVMCFGVV